MKRYSCCICHKILKEKPIRLLKQEYGAGRYNQYAQVDKYDICFNCYQVFDRWLKKHQNNISYKGGGRK